GGIYISPREYEKADNRIFICVLSALRLCVWLFDNCGIQMFTLIKVSCLHLGQNSGKYFSSVSPRIFSLVLFPQTGQRNHSEIGISQLKFLYPLKTLVFPAFSPPR